MSRIILSKQIELASTSRMIAISDGTGKLNFENHAQSLVSDADYLLWVAASDPLDFTNDYILIQSASEGKLVRIPIGDILGVFQNGLTQPAAGVTEIGGTLIKDTVIGASGFNFSITALNDLFFQGTNQAQLNFDDELNLISGVLIDLNAPTVEINVGGSPILIGSNPSTNIQVAGRMNIAPTNNPTDVGSDCVLVWDGAAVVGQPSFQAYSPGSGGDDWGSQVVISDSTLSGDGTSGNPLSVVGGGGPSRAVLIDNIGLDIRHFGPAPSLVDNGSGQYTLTLPFGCVILRSYLLLDATMLNGGTGDLTLIVDNSASGDSIYIAYNGLINLTNDQYVPPVDSGFGNQLISVDDGAGTSTHTFTNLGGFGNFPSGGCRLILSAF